MPPRHGKSEMISHYLPAWYLGWWPERHVLLCSYEATFAASWGRKARDTFAEAAEAGLFKHKLNPDRAAASEWEIARHGGGMVTAGVGGAITGRGADLLILDDPVKNAEEAQSLTYREKSWDWYLSTFATRCEPGAAVIIIETRWHYDDIAGRILATADGNGERWEVVSLPAIAEENDQLGRLPGEALWPARYPVPKLESIRHNLGSYWWSALYQQRPSPREGGMFKRQWFPIVEAGPAVVDVDVRFWDKAATAGSGDWTVGLRMQRRGGEYYIVDVQRCQESSGAVKALIRQTAALDGPTVRIGMEQEPGSSGKDVIEDYRRELAGYAFQGVPATGSKQVRAEPLAAQAEGGNVKLLRAPWNPGFLDEICSFPTGAHDDQVDAAAGAFRVIHLLAARPQVVTIQLTEPVTI
jgi:predicted phage terminase large subunit-like protein